MELTNKQRLKIIKPKQNPTNQIEKPTNQQVLVVTHLNTNSQFLAVEVLILNAFFALRVHVVLKFCFILVAAQAVTGTAYMYKWE